MTTLPYSSLAQLVGTAFRVRADGTDVESEMVMTEISDRRLSVRWESFSVLFRAPVGVHFAQGQLSFDHPTLGPFHLFLVPIAPDQQGPLYEAVFNRERTPDD